MKYIIYKSLTYAILLALLCSSVSAQYNTDESFGVVAQGQSYVITPSGFKEPPGPGEGAGVVVDPFRFVISGSSGEDEVTVVLTLPDSFASDNGTDFIPLMNWTYRVCDDGFTCAGPLYKDTITVPIFTNGLGILWLGGVLQVPTTASLGTYAAAIRASFDGKDTTVYRSLETVLSTDVGEEKFVPLHFDLQQNYPNPFNPSTTIRYDIPKSSHVTLKIYNLLGQEMATLVNEQKFAESYWVHWNANGFSNGVYFYRLQAGLFVETKKLMLMK